MGFAGCIPRFLKRHAGWILAGLGSAGFFGTVILTAKEAPKAREELEEAEFDKICEWSSQHPEANPEDSDSFKDVALPKEAYLTWWERVKIAFPHYIPAILTGAGTLACFWGGQIFNAKKQAALVTAYGALAMQFDQYRSSIRENCGDETDRRAYIYSQKRIKELEAEVDRLKAETEPYLYELASLPGVIFAAKPIDIHDALMHFNRNLVLGGENSLDELYRFIGIPEECYNVEEAENYGWNEFSNEVDWGIRYVDFTMESVMAKNGKMVNIIKMPVPPYLISSIDDSDSFEQPYWGYSEGRAETLAKNLLESSELTKIFHPHITTESLWL